MAQARRTVRHLVAIAISVSVGVAVASPARSAWAQAAAATTDTYQGALGATAIDLRSDPDPESTMGGYARLCAERTFKHARWSVGPCLQYAYARPARVESSPTPWRARGRLHTATATLSGWIPLLPHVRLRAGVGLGASSLAVPERLLSMPAITGFSWGADAALLLDVSKTFSVELGADATELTFFKQGGASLSPWRHATRLAGYLGLAARWR